MDPALIMGVDKETKRKRTKRDHTRRYRSIPENREKYKNYMREYMRKRRYPNKFHPTPLPPTTPCENKICPLNLLALVAEKITYTPQT